MKPRLISIRAGFTNVYLVVQNGKGLLVDTGNRSQNRKITKAITSLSLKLTDLKYIFLTHTHFDHAGSVASLKEHTGAKVILHESEAGFLEKGFTPIPHGTNMLFKFISNAGKAERIEKRIGWFPPAEAEITFTDSCSLKPIGFDAEIIHTPGHTAGSSTLIVGDKAIVGDTMFNMLGKYYPGFANDETALIETWKKLIGLDVEWYYPAHGKRIRKDKLKKEARQRGIIH